MVDVAGIVASINLARLRQHLGVPIVVMQANQATSVCPSLKARRLVGTEPQRPDSPFPRAFPEKSRS